MRKQCTNAIFRDIFQTLHKSSAICMYVEIINRLILRGDQPSAAENIKEHSLIYTEYTFSSRRLEQRKQFVLNAARATRYT